MITPVFRMKRSLILLVLGILPLASAQAEAPKPNILLIMADDLGFSDLGCYGGEIQTPHLDSLAENGLRFTQFYNTGRCWPTRGSLLTGYYAQQIRRDDLPGVPSGGGDGNPRPDWAVLLPKQLKPAGYRSYHTGKWHIDGMPVENGFDRSYYLRDQGRFFHPTKHWRDDVPLPAVEKESGYYATTALADHVIEVLKEHETEHADAPFFHYLAFAAPHFPLHALPEDIAVYADTYDEGWESIRAKRWRRMGQLGLPGGVGGLSRTERELGPPYHFPDAFAILGPGEVNLPLPWDRLTEAQQRFQADKMAIHAAMIHRMDVEIGRVFDQIKAMGRWDNTLVIFLSDNGASAEIMVRDDGHDPAASPGSAATYLCLGPGWSTASNTPFRRHKTWTHEGGIATPLVVSWPKGIAARGELRTTPGHVIDVVPTLLELAGAEPLAEAPPAPGKSLVPLFSEDGSVKHESLWWFHDGHRAMRQGDWKAVAAAGEPWELYDLSRDREESTDLAPSHPEKLSELVSAWESKLAEIKALASRDLAPSALAEAEGVSSRPSRMREAQERAAKPRRSQVLMNAETFELNGRPAFVMKPESATDKSSKPWVFYGPTLPKYPDQNEAWMHRQFLDAGIAVAGIDVGEAYGSPLVFSHFEALHAEMVKRGYSQKPVLLGRSRGGLWVSSWALAHPDRVAGIAGIYPVFDHATYPGLKRAAPVHGLTEESLGARAEEFNPIRRVGALAEAGIPVCLVHGVDDTVVPLAANSAKLEEIYRARGAGDLVTLIRVEGQGHNLWPGFFQNEELVAFVKARAKGE